MKFLDERVYIIEVPKSFDSIARFQMEYSGIIEYILVKNMYNSNKNLCVIISIFDGICISKFLLCTLLVARENVECDVTSIMFVCACFIEISRFVSR